MKRMRILNTAGFPQEMCKINFFLKTSIKRQGWNPIFIDLELEMKIPDLNPTVRWIGMFFHTLLLYLSMVQSPIRYNNKQHDTGTVHQAAGTARYRC